MKNIIYITKYYCEICEKEITLRVFGEHGSTFPESEKEKKDVQEWGMFYHQKDSHQMCAICGKPVLSGTEEAGERLDLIDKKLVDEIHHNYIKHTLGVLDGETFLIAHEGCINN